MEKFIKNKLPFIEPILKPILNELRQAKLRFATTEKIFTGIYNENKWGNKQSRSGPGSTLIQTETIRSRLPELLEGYHIHSILDIPCGDFNWMIKLKMNNISYTGLDIVHKVIDLNNKKYIDLLNSLML